MYINGRPQMQGRCKIRRGALAEISDDAIIVYVRISKIIQIWYGIKIVVVETQNMIFGGRNI